MSRHMTERTTIRLPEDLIARAKRKAAAEGRTLTSLIEDGLRLVTTEDRKPGKTKRVMPPISKATGGLRPGIDLTRFSEIQGRDDLEIHEAHEALQMILPRRQCPDLRLPHRQRPPRGLPCVAGGSGLRRCPLRHRAARAERRRAHHDRPPHLYEPEPGGGGVPLLRHASWPASLSDRRARRASLGPLPAPLPRDEHAGLAGHRRLVRRACDRMGLRVGDDGPRLCTVPGPEMGDARTRSRVA